MRSFARSGEELWESLPRSIWAHMSADLHLMARGHGGCHRQSKAEGCSLAEAAFDRDLATQRFYQPTDQREAKAGAFPRAVCESPEYGWQAFGFDAAPAVLHHELNAVFEFRRFKADLAACWCIAKRVREEIVHDTAQRATIGIDMG